MKSHFLFMTKDIKIFENPEFGQVRVVMNDSNEPLFCLVDVCRVLGITNSRNVINRLEEKGVHSIDTLTNGGNQLLNYINEPNLYRVIFQSRKDESKKFQDWIFEEVIPSIRKTGSYSLRAMSPAEIIIAQGQAMLALEQKQLELQAVQNQQRKDIEYLKTKAIHRPDYYSIVGFSNKVKVKVGLEKAKKLGKICVNLCKQRGYITERIEDPRFGYIRTYPHNILEEVFAREFNLNFD